MFPHPRQTTCFREVFGDFVREVVRDSVREVFGSFFREVFREVVLGGLWIFRRSFAVKLFGRTARTRASKFSTKNPQQTSQLVLLGLTNPPGHPL